MPEITDQGQSGRGLKGQPEADEARRIKAEQRALDARPAVKTIAEHTVKKGETLSHIALAYYGSAARENWMQIYEANKDVLGDNYNLIRPGQVLKIPELKE